MRHSVTTTPYSPDEPVTAALLSLLRRGPGPEATELEALREEEWTRLVYRAKVHRVAPLIYRRLVTDGLTSAVPASALEFLRDESLRNSLHNMKIFQALGEVLDALNARGIPVMLLKGVHLAEFYYPDRTLRPMSDIDIMVKFADYDEAAAALLHMGYAWRDLTNTRDLHLRYPRHVSLTNSQGVAVELHRTFEPRQRPPRIEMDPIWDRAESVAVGGKSAFGLAPEDLLLHLCMHMACQDCFATGLISLSDASRVIESMNGEFPWERFVERAEEWGSTRSAYLVVLLIRELLGVEPPEHLLPALRPAEVTTDLEDEVRSLALSGNEAAIQEPLALLRLAGPLPFALKAKVLLGRVFVSRQYLANAYDAKRTSLLIYTYYIRRLWDLVKRYSQTAWGLLQHDPGLTQKSTRIVRQDRLRIWLNAD
ncbi:MAG: nucleotidyltransferase family protein [Armatimonadetes bacterium]|nr:nucleotidyltransferase family protein [Armatimonadota bacterium]